ncbi:Chaperone J-domain superfamily [Arabidopsis suecica]|uniref:Chaperone J-domain superfamily n=1 Tax=Arabidopsis suecica TaxID=45249 RepID=A0A8T1YP48_ARASU|nr:Chaperone J-domain superfamily [Arabidopsis suecica]
MDDFTGLLARDFGLKPQGKSAPMASQSNSSASDFNSFASSYSFANAAGKKSESLPVFDDLGRDGDDLLFKDVFSGPPSKYGSSSGDSRSPPAPAFDYDAMFKEPKSKPASSMPVYDKPVYDDEDVFESIPELKIPSTSSQSARFDDVFSSPHKHRKQNSSPFDDLMGNNLGKKGTESDREHKGSSIFDDLIPGFGRTSSPPPKRTTSETTDQSQKPLYQTAETSSNVEEDPFVVLEESASTPREPSTGGFTDPLEDIGKFNSRKTDNSSVHRGVFVDIDPLDSLGKSGPDMNSRGKSHLRPPGNISGSQSPPVESPGSYHSKKVSFDDVLEPQNTSTPPPTNSNGSFESSDDVWLTVSEIPLFTQPTSAPPPSRPPPPRPTRPIKKKVNEPSIPASTNHSHVPSSGRASVNSPTAYQMDELDDFSISRNQTAANGYPDPPSGEDSDVFSAAAASAAAMKDAMDKAEAKFRHAKERRVKENLKASRNREEDQTENYESRERELREKQVRLDRERAEREAEMVKEQEREREEREREQKRIERERERLLARQAVERATREARERAATEAHAKVQRAAVGKATDARERAERAAVQRAHAEARERAAAGAREKAAKAAAEAREKAEKAAAEARERVNAEAREKEARVRAERAAVERAAAEARGRAAAQAKAKQQQENNNDLDSFFSSVSRPNSVPRQRTNPLDPFQDSWNKGGSFESSRGSSRVPSGPTENLRKASSVTNIVDDLSSIFGASATQSGGFQDVDGETEERRRARLERHQRTQERAAKALAEKNERDLQVQREQAEKDRIGETLDVEIRRWGAGKEGNLRALLSTLQYVLWPECGWQPVSLTDLITGASVKKVYRKATLCIHPDKVQQKGANLQQKYIAEKVFDMLKEAWNKFNSEELF